MTGKQPHEHGRDGKHPAKRHQMENPEEYGQVPGEVSHREPSHPGVADRPAGAKESGGVKGGEQAKPGKARATRTNPRKIKLPASGG